MFGLYSQIAYLCTVLVITQRPKIVKKAENNEFLQLKNMNEIENETLDKMVLGIKHDADERIAQTLKHYEAGKRDCENGIYEIGRAHV